jgi:hypothetical protein
MVSNPRYVRLRNLWDNNCGLTEPVRLCAMIQDEYEKELRKRTIDKKPWALRQIYLHFTEHSPSSVGMLEDSLRVINSAMHILKREGIFQQEKGGGKRRRLDERNLNMYLKLFCQRKSLVQEIQGKRPTNVA